MYVLGLIMQSPIWVRVRTRVRVRARVIVRVIVRVWISVRTLCVSQCSHQLGSGLVFDVIKVIAS